MIILAYGAGDHSNRLFQNIHFEAFCKEYNIDYINPSFFNMYKYYVSPCRLNKGLKGMLLKQNYLNKIMKKFNIIKNIISFDNENNMELISPPHPTKP
jgi:hypothetical protein